MSDYLTAVICIVVALLILVLKKAYFSLPDYELKRLASRGDKFAQAIYPAISYSAFRGLLWVVLAALSSAAVILLNRKVPLWLGIIFAVVWLWLVFSWIPNRRSSSASKRFAQVSAPLFTRILHYIYPLIRHLEKIEDSYQAAHTRVYENEDLRTFLRRQARQSDNRISKEQLDRLTKLVTFEDAKVKNYMRPWKKSMRLIDDELIGPKLMDEMHHSQQSAFVVVKSASSKDAIGILSKSSVTLNSEGKVRDYIRGDVEYINDEEPIELAINLFALGSQPLLVVKDKENEVLGTLTLKDALSALIELDVNKSDQSDETVDEIKKEAIESQ